MTGNAYLMSFITVSASRHDMIIVYQQGYVVGKLIYSIQEVHARRYKLTSQYHQIVAKETSLPYLSMTAPISSHCDFN